MVVRRQKNKEPLPVKSSTVVAQAVVAWAEKQRVLASQCRQRMENVPVGRHLPQRADPPNAVIGPCNVQVDNPHKRTPANGNRQGGGKDLVGSKQEEERWQVQQ